VCRGEIAHHSRATLTGKAGGLTHGCMPSWLMTPRAEMSNLCPARKISASAEGGKKLLRMEAVPFICMKTEPDMTKCHMSNTAFGIQL